MSIATTDNKVKYAGNGATTEWPFSFAVLETSHLKVIITNSSGVETTLTSDYVVDLTNKKVTYPGYLSGEEPDVTEQPPILPTGSYITLLRVVPYTQETDLGERWPFTTIEAALDKLTMESQQLAEGVARAVKTPVSSDLSPDEILASIKASETNSAGSATAAYASKTAAELAETNAESAQAAAEAAAVTVGGFLDYSAVAKTRDIITKGPVVDVRAFGATATKLQEAIDSIAFGSVFIPVDINLDTDVTVKSGVSLLGKNTVLTTNGLHSIYFKGNQTVHGITFDGGLACTIGVSVEGEDVVFTNNVVKNYKSVSAAYPTWGMTIQSGANNISIVGNKFENFQPYNENGVTGDAEGTTRAIQISTEGKVLIRDNVFSGMVGIEDGDYIYVGTSAIASSIPEFGGSYYSFCKTVIDNNIFYDTTKSAVKLQGSDAIVTNNVILPNAAGVAIGIRGQGVYGAIIRNNIIKFNGAAANCAIQFYNSINLVIEGNSIDMYSSGAVIYGMYFSTCGDSVVEGNRITLNGSLNATLTFAACNNFNVFKNSFYGCQIKTLVLSDSTIVGNEFSGRIAAIEFTDTGATPSSNVTFARNVCFVADRFIGLRNNDKTNIKIVCNTVDFTSMDTSSLLAFYYAGQTKANVIVIGNTPAIGVDYGDTSSRPAINKYVGYRYYDTTIGKPIYWTGTGWKDATGTAV